MALERYRAKRDFRRTPEPRGGSRVARSAGRSFVVQKHAARNLHYDFRLEHDGVLWSWAIPKGPSLDPADKRLAIHVEDHPLEYGGFEGVIPEGEYGGGTVIVWDRGTWTPEGDPAEGYARGRLVFTLDGEKLKGGFALIRTRGGRARGKSGKEAWLLVKERDAFARRGDGQLVDDAPDSVLSGRTIDEIGRARSRVWRGKLSPKANIEAGAIAPERRAPKSAPRTPTGRKTAPMPAALRPMLATLVASAPAGDDWIHEIKYDGYRMLCRIERGRAHLYSRTGKDWTSAFPAVARDLAALPVTRAWVDGEVAALDEKGRTGFQALQNALSGAGAERIAFFAFDLLHRDGSDLRRLPLVERKRLLREIVGTGSGTVRVGPEARGNGEEFHRQACALGLEGSVAKKADSPYASGTRSRDWLKVKCVQRQEMVIGGYTDAQGARKGFGALLLGVYDRGKLRYAGKVGTGFDEKALHELAPQLARREQQTPPFADPPRGYAAKGVHWVRPDLVAEVAFTEWSAGGALRHPSFQGLRLDKKATDVVREKAMAKAAAGGTTKGPRTKPRGGGAKPEQRAPRGDAGALASIALSNPDKSYFPEAGITKRDLADYYVAVAAQLVPHIEGRPLSLVRCPDGWPRQCFYQKHAHRSVHAGVARVEVPENKGTATYLAANSDTALVALVQWGVIELHPWGARTPRLDRPDRLVFDFDPGDGVPWQDLVAAVTLLRALLSEVGLVGFLKTTGGKGLHVVLPIRATLEWDEAKAFTRTVAEFLARTFPDRFTTSLAKEARKDRIFIDYLRNARGATAIAPYAVRARAHAPVATPLAWTELGDGDDVRFAHFNVRNVPQRLAGMRADPWADFLAARQSITAAMRRRFA
jgi:bifunctional non-homologous end joining protein LigD